MFSKFKSFIKKKLFHLLILIFLAIILLSYATMIQPLNCDNTEFIIPQGASLSYVVNKLEEESCTANGVYLKYMMIVMNKDKKIKPGIYDLSGVEDNYQLINLITSDSVEMIAIRILEGWAIEKINREFFEVFQIDTLKFKSLCDDSQLIKSLGINANSLEGYLYPDTYLFSTDFIHSDTKEIDIITTLVNEFKRKYKEATKGNLNTNLSMHQLVTLASIIQGECVYTNEMDTVSSVYSNRLKKGMLLQADPTIQYIIPGPNKRLYNKDYTKYKSSPYNTYSHKGLPPGPISSPGFYALRAAAYPAETNFLFFVAKGDNLHHFTSNERDHINAKNKYLKNVWRKP